MQPPASAVLAACSIEMSFTLARKRSRPRQREPWDQEQGPFPDIAGSVLVSCSAQTTAANRIPPVAMATVAIATVTFVLA
ncbi:hypothetical protein SAMD00023353_4100920 [Rosellinia necatrix]|uniref:Uncharacterized protein n=1 Tax=Rosellinia necatrix TaxID=77044 RepID=A0A1S8AAC6_ROSNE|nr:hypothetical protein SAMD00023353_4100920 [Rosellinia necatrix]